jgi:hypothetical protein
MTIPTTSEDDPLTDRSSRAKLSANRSSVGSRVGACACKSKHVRAIFSMPFFPLGFWDGVFSEVHMSRLRRTFLATGVRIVDMPLLI